MSNKTLTEELHKPIIRKFNKRTVHSFFMYVCMYGWMDKWMSDGLIDGSMDGWMDR